MKNAKLILLILLLSATSCTTRVEKSERTIVQPERVVVEKKPEVTTRERIVETDGMGVRQQTTTEYSR